VVVGGFNRAHAVSFSWLQARRVGRAPGIAVTFGVGASLPRKGRTPRSRPSPDSGRRSVVDVSSGAAWSKVTLCRSAAVDALGASGPHPALLARGFRGGERR
jgi:hypothetical protein